VYDSYCTVAGYPNNNANVQTTTTVTGNSPSETVVTSELVLTVTVGSSTTPVTEPGAAQTITSPASTSSANSSPSISTSNRKVNIGAIVGGVVGGLALIAVIMIIVFVLLPRWTKRQEDQGQERAAPISKSGGGRAELQGEEKTPAVTTQDMGFNQEQMVEDVTKPDLSPEEIDGAPKYGLRSEELDAEGRYVGELHGDGRQVTEVELPGS
jgi:hypothetical protein